MSKIENTADGTVRLNQEYPARENPQLTDILLVGNLESGEIGNTTAGQIKTLYTGAIAEDNSGFVRGDEVSAALALKADSETVDTALDTKVDKVAGMGLSHEDYTAPEKDDVATLSMFYKPVNDALDTVNGKAVRGGVPGKLAKLAESKENIRQAIIGKGVKVTEQEPLAEYAEKIRTIRTQDGEWIPNPAWPDIEKMVDDMEGDYNQIHAYVLDDKQDMVPLNLEYENMHCLIKPLGDLIRLSDGSSYTGEEITKTCSQNSTNDFWHTWDKTKDTVASDGKIYRWILVATKNTDNSVFMLPSTADANCSTDYLYAVIKSDVPFVSPTYRDLNLRVSRKCECIKFTGKHILNPYNKTYYQFSYSELEYEQNNRNTRQMYRYDFALRYLIWRNNPSGTDEVLNIEGKGMDRTWAMSRSALILPKRIVCDGGMIPTMAKEIQIGGNGAYSSYYVIASGDDIEKIVIDESYTAKLYDISQSSFTNGPLPSLVHFESHSSDPNLNSYLTFKADIFSSLQIVILPQDSVTTPSMYADGPRLSKESLLNILHALKADPDKQHTLYLKMNKARLTEEEKAIATNKNWLLA